MTAQPSWREERTLDVPNEHFVVDNCRETTRAPREYYEGKRAIGPIELYDLSPPRARPGSKGSLSLRSRCGCASSTRVGPNDTGVTPSGIRSGVHIRRPRPRSRTARFRRAPHQRPPASEAGDASPLTPAGARSSARPEPRPRAGIGNIAADRTGDGAASTILAGCDARAAHAAWSTQAYFRHHAAASESRREK